MIRPASDHGGPTRPAPRFPRTRPPITIRLDDAMLARLRAEADRAGVGLSEWIRRRLEAPAVP